MSNLKERQDDMKILTFLFFLAAMSLGFAGGMTFMAIFSKDTIKALRSENRQLRSDIRLLKKQKKDTVEVIYSRGFDGETTVDCPDFSQRW